MKYLIIDDKQGDLFITECATESEAIAKGREQWERLTAAEQKRRNAFYILKSRNEDESAADHTDGDIIKAYK